MRVRAERDQLVEALALASRIAGARSTQPVLGGTRLRASLDPSTLTASATDLDIHVSRRIAADVTEPGDVVIQARIGHEVVRSLPGGQVSINSATPGSLEIIGERGRFELRTMPVEDFPRGPQLEGSAATAELPAAALGAAFSQVARAASTDDARPILTAVLIDASAAGTNLVATDSYRLGVRKMPELVLGEGPQTALIPARALQEVGRLAVEGTMSMALSQREARFEVGNTALTTRLIEGEFIRYAQLIPADYPHRLTGDKAVLIEAIRRVGLMAINSIPLRLHLSSEGVALTVENADVGEAREDLAPPIKYEGEEMIVAFNQRYLLDGLDAMPGSTVRLELIEATKPAVLRPDDEGSPDYLYLLMPVRI